MSPAFDLDIEYSFLHIWLSRIQTKENPCGKDTAGLAPSTCIMDKHSWFYFSGASQIIANCGT
jgi:hypothetical protein